MRLPAAMSARPLVCRGASASLLRLLVAAFAVTVTGLAAALVASSMPDTGAQSKARPGGERAASGKSTDCTLDKTAACPQRSPRDARIAPRPLHGRNRTSWSAAPVSAHRRTASRARREGARGCCEATMSRAGPSRVAFTRGGWRGLEVGSGASRGLCSRRRSRVLVMQQSISPLPSFMRDARPSPWARAARDSAHRWHARRVAASGALRRGVAGAAAALESAVSALSNAAEQDDLLPHAQPIDRSMWSTSHERLMLAAVIVMLHAWPAALGSSVAALPMIIGGIGVAAMVIWIGWYWADEA
jgi:hypothetical protein